MATIEVLGETWTVQNGLVTAYLIVDGRDGSSVAWGLKHWAGWGYDAVTTENTEGSNVATDPSPWGLVTVSVPITRFKDFLMQIARDEDVNDFALYPTVEHTIPVENGTLAYAETSIGKALLALTSECV